MKLRNFAVALLMALSAGMVFGQYSGQGLPGLTCTATGVPNTANASWLNSSTGVIWICGQVPGQANGYYWWRNLIQGYSYVSGGVAYEVLSGQLVNSLPIRDTSAQVLTASMTAVDTAGVAVGSTGSGNTTFVWPVASGFAYNMQCKLPVTFVASATIAFELTSTTGPVTMGLVNAESAGNTNTSAAFQDLFATGTAITTPTTTTGAPGGVSEMVSVGFQFIASASGTIGLEFIGNGANNVQLLKGGECGLTQIN